MDAPIISISGLHLDGVDQPRLYDVGAEFFAGRIVGIIGPNGAGKSSLLSILAGVEAGWTGSISLRGKDFRSWSRAERAGEIAYVPQDFRCHWALTVEELVQLSFTRRIGFGWQTGRPRIAELDWVYAAFELEDFRHRVFGALSGGEKARATLAAAVAVRPSVLLADEPVASLDPYHQLEAIDHLRTLAITGTVIVIVLHDLTLAARFCDDLVLLDRGRIACSGTATAVLREDLLAGAYRVETLIGTHLGERFVLPWARLGASRVR